MSNIPTVYLEWSVEDPSDLEGYICHDVFDVDVDQYCFYTEKQAPTEFYLDEQCLYKITGCSFEKIETTFLNLHDSEKLSFIESLDHTLLKYRVLYQLNNVDPVQSAEKTMKQYSSDKKQVGIYEALLNPIDEYKLVREKRNRTAWTNKKNQFYISYVKDIDKQYYENPQGEGNWKWGLMSYNWKNISKQDKKQISSLSKPSYFFSSLKEAKQHATQTFKKVLKEDCFKINMDLTSVSEPLGGYVEYNFKSPLHEKLVFLPALKFCFRVSDYWEISDDLQYIIKQQLPEVCIPYKFKTRKSIILFLHNLLSDNLQLFYDYNLYTTVKQQSMIDVTELWWLMFVNPEIDLTKIF